jgi:hypothetical protein
MLFQVMFSDEVCGKEKPFTIVDSRVSSGSNRQEIHVLLLWVDGVQSQLDEGDECITFVTKLEWVTLAEGRNILLVNISTCISAL